MINEHYYADREADKHATVLNSQSFAHYNLMTLFLKTL